VAGVILARGSGGSELRKEVLNTIATAIPAARVCRAEKALALGLLDRLPCAVPVGGYRQLTHIVDKDCRAATQRVIAAF
jgi:hypothetical protein